MIPEIDRHRGEIIALCEEYDLERLEVFGSAASGDFDPDKSDIDFLVVCPGDFDYGEWGSGITDLRKHFEAILGRDVDLVVLRYVKNSYVRASIEQNRTLLYAS